MIKCPNCGSTAQVKKVYYEYDECAERAYWFYECGCGTDFRIEEDWSEDFFLNHNGKLTPIDNPFRDE